MSERFEMTLEETSNVHKMANFIALFHTRPFIQSRLASLAPAVDLRYLSKMSWLKKKMKQWEMSQSNLFVTTYGTLRRS